MSSASLTWPAQIAANFPKVRVSSTLACADCSERWPSVLRREFAVCRTMNVLEETQVEDRPSTPPANTFKYKVRARGARAAAKPASARRHPSWAGHASLAGRCGQDTLLFDAHTGSQAKPFSRSRIFPIENSVRTHCTNPCLLPGSRNPRQIHASELRSPDESCYVRRVRSSPRIHHNDELDRLAQALWSRLCSLTGTEYGK